MRLRIFNGFISEVGGGESFVTPPTGKSCFVFVFALRACVRATRREISVLSRHVFVAALLLLFFFSSGPWVPIL